jgi:hypothetical protein
MRRISFLTVFFIALGAAFAVALAMRIRSFHEAAPAAAVGGGQPPSAVQSGVTTTTDVARVDSGGPLSSTETTATIIPYGSSPAKAERARIREQLMREPVVVATSTTAPVAPRPQPVPVPIAPAPKPQPRPTSLPPSAVQQRMAAAAAASGTAGGSSSSTPPATSTAPKESKDPNSDTVPPQLQGIDFDPPTVHDGEEAHIVLLATDDLSGIRGISGTITSPTGKALQGFAGVREPEGNRYIGRFVVPKDGEEGVWRVNVITMSDNASNSVTLSLAQGTLPPNAGLRVVSSSSDSTAPVLKSVRVEKRSMQIGEPNPIYIEADDDKSGVNVVSPVFQSPTKKARIGAACTRAEGLLWKCELALPQCIDCGDWQLEQVTLQDKANNLATFRVDNPIVAAVKINVAGESCDSEAPRLHGIVLDQNMITMSGQPTAVTVTLTVSDDACGVEGASIQYAGPGTGSGGFVPMQRVGDDQTWVGKIPLDPRAPRGNWRINSVQLTDKGHNLRIYYATDPLLANATFTVR